MNNYPKVPLCLKQVPQWVNWKAISREGRPTKMPVRPDGTPASSTEPKTWSSFKEVAEASGTFSGVGFVFSESDCFIGIDLDGCRDPKSGQLDDWAREIVLQFRTYTEVSPSETGVKLFGSSGSKWPHRNKIDLPLPMVHGKAPGVEVYDAGRFFCVTGRQLKDMHSITPVDEHFDWLADKIGMRHAEMPIAGDGIRLETPVMDRAAKYVAKMEPSVSGQSGHNRCFQAACALVMGFGLTVDEAYRVLVAEFNPRCEPNWSERELMHKIASANKQPGARNYLRDAEPVQWNKLRLPGSYKEHRESEEIAETSTVRKTTLHKASMLYLAELASGREQLIDSGIPELDYALGGGIAMGEMVIVAARPSHGKSAVALQMAHQMSANGLPVVLVSEEMSAIALGKRAIQFASETPEEYWKTSIEYVSGEVDRHFGTRKEIIVIESCGTVDRACDEIEKTVNEQNSKVAMVDYAQLLTAKGASRYESITMVSQRLRMLASRLQIVIVVLAQLNRSIEKRNTFVPQMSDIKETGQLEQDADVIVFGVWPHRIDSSKPSIDYQFYIAKNRNRAIRESVINCSFNPARQMLLESESMKQHDDFVEYR